MNWLPPHECGLHLTHNEHRDVYEDVVQYYDAETFVSAAEFEKAIAEDSVWTLQWYPKTPIGFHVIRASSLDAIKKQLEENSYD